MKKSNRVIAELNGKDLKFDVEYTTYLRHGAIIAKEIARSFEKVIALGGDGTANKVGGFIVAPDAEIDDGILDVTIMREASLLKLLLNINSAMTRNLNKLDEVDTIRGENITIDSDYPMPLHVDGEVVSMTSGKVSASILKGVLKVLSN